MRWALTRSECKYDTIKIIALHADSMPVRASKGLKNDTKSRSSLIKILTSKNIIKPCFQVAASCSRSCLSKLQLATKIPKGCQQKISARPRCLLRRRRLWPANLRPDHPGGINRQLLLRYAPKSLSIKYLSAFCSRQLVKNIIGGIDAIFSKHVFE